jgi:hypothetical protein
MENLEQLFLIISPKKFHILKFFLEAYDNLGIISSYQNKRGIVLVRYNRANAPELMGFLSSLASELKAFDS